MSTLASCPGSDRLLPLSPTQRQISGREIESRNTRARDSSRVTQVISRPGHLFRVELPMSSLFETPTAAGLAAALGGGLAVQAESDRLDTIPRQIEGLRAKDVIARLERGKPLTEEDR